MGDGAFEVPIAPDTHPDRIFFSCRQRWGWEYPSKGKEAAAIGLDFAGRGDKIGGIPVVGYGAGEG